MTAVAVSGPISSATAQVAPAYAADCKVDGNIIASDQSPADALALSATRNMLGGNREDLLEQMSQAARLATPAPILGLSMAQLAAAAPYWNVHVAHTYEIDGERRPNPLPKMICGRSPGDPNAVALSVMAVPHQFYVDVVAHTINNDWSTIVALMPEAGVLKVLYIHTQPSAISGRTASDVRKLALEQVARGHQVNAVILYRVAEGLADRGPNVIPVWKPDLDREVDRLRLPEGVGRVSGPLRLAGQTLAVGDIGVIGIGGNLNLQIVRRTDRWPGDELVDTDSRSFIKVLLKDHPELADSFAAITVLAMKPDKSGGFGTVYEFGKGFDRPPAVNTSH